MIATALVDRAIAFARAVIAVWTCLTLLHGILLHWALLDGILLNGVGCSLIGKARIDIHADRILGDTKRGPEGFMKVNMIGPPLAGVAHPHVIRMVGQIFDGVVPMIFGTGIINDGIKFAAIGVDCALTLLLITVDRDLDRHTANMIGGHRRGAVGLIVLPALSRSPE